MQYKRLGNTDLKISRITLGTVELGIDYGFRGSEHYNRPDRLEAIEVIHRAVDLGVNLIDTARTYGSSEEIIGQALKELKGRVRIASKVAINETFLGKENPEILRGEIKTSIDMSLQALGREVIDLIQLHNTSLSILSCEEVMRALEDAQREGKVRFLGASCSDEEVALRVLEMGCFRALQLPFNILDQKIIARVLPRALELGVGVFARSVFLRGVLTNQVHALPARLSALKEAALQALQQFQGHVQSLSELALRFVLSFDELTSIVIGVRSVPELESNIVDYNRGRLLPNQLRLLGQIPLVEPSLADIRNWGNLI
jgi:1-deoxyxylulose-5-phosphate synthase